MTTEAIALSIAAQRDFWIAECNTLRQEVAELRHALRDVVGHLEFASAGFEPGSTARENADTAVKSARIVLAGRKK